MKRTLIGGFIMFGGLFITLTIILAATIYIPNMSSWSGSQLWYAIFGGEQYEDEVVGSIHCFSGSLEMANEFIKLGFCIGVGGIVTFNNAKNVVNVIKNIE